MTETPFEDLVWVRFTRPSDDAEVAAVRIDGWLVKDASGKTSVVKPDDFEANYERWN